MSEVSLGRKKSSFLLAGLIGVIVFELSIGPHVLSPTWISWLYASIREQYESAWLAYRFAPWSFPLGKLPLIFYPHGSSIAFMDGAPWYLTLLKILNPILPEYFAAWGWWLLVCCIFQALTARRLMTVISTNEPTRWIGTLLLTCSPVFFERSLHFTLMAQGFVLLAWSLFFEEKKSVSKRWYWLATLTAVAGIHPYLTVMVFSIRVTSLVFSSASIKERTIDLFSSLITVISVFSIFGYFQNGTTTDIGADFFAADLFTFFLSFGTGSLWPTMSTSPGEQEGYAYLGAGVIVLLVATLLLLIKRKDIFAVENVSSEDSWICRRAAQGLIAATALFIFSLGTHLRVFSFEIAANAKTSNPMYMLFFGKLKELPLIFRAPGRFCWPLYYLIVAFTVRALSRRLLILYLAIILQFIDIGPFMINSHLRIASGTKPPILKNSIVAKQLRNANEIFFIPLEPRMVCGLEHNAETYDLMKGVLPIAAQYKIPFNSGIQARTPPELHELCDLQIEKVRKGDVKPGAVYIIDRKFLSPNLIDPTNSLLSCTNFTNISICLGEDPLHQTGHHVRSQDQFHKHFHA